MLVAVHERLSSSECGASSGQKLWNRRSGDSSAYGMFSECKCSGWPSVWRRFLGNSGDPFSSLDSEPLRKLRNLLSSVSVIVVSDMEPARIGGTATTRLLFYSFHASTQGQLTRITETTARIIVGQQYGDVNTAALLLLMMMLASTAG